MFSDAILAVLWLVVLWRAPTLLQNRWKRAPWIALATLAVALTSNLPAVVPVIDHATGIADLSTLIEHASGIVASTAVLDWVAALANPGREPRLRSRHAIAAAVIACMIVLFTIMPRPQTTDFTASVTGGLAAAYLLVFYAYLGTAMSVATVLFWRVSRVSPRGTLRWGLWLLATGTSGGACYCVYQITYLALRSSGALSAADARGLFDYGDDIQSAAIMLILAGMSVPAFGVAWRAAGDLASLRALRGMWRDLVSAVPGVTAGPWKRGVAGPVRDPRIRLIRRTAEIRDAALALRCFVPASLVEESRRRLAETGRPTGTALDAAVEACWLEFAVRAARAGAAAAEPAHVLPGGATLEEEVRWLRQVAAAIRSDPVRAVAAELADAPLIRPGGELR